LFLKTEELKVSVFSKSLPRKCYWRISYDILRE